MPSTPGTVGLAAGGAHSILNSDIGGTGFVYLAAGNKIWRLSSDRTTVNEVGSLTGGVGGVVDSTTSLLDWMSDTTSLKVASLTEAGTVVTVTTTVPHGLKTGMSMTMTGATDAKYNIVAVITVTGPKTFTYTAAAGATSPDTSTSATAQIPAVRRLYAFTIGSTLTSRYWMSADGAAWTEAGRTVWDALIWDKKLIGSMPLPSGGPYGPGGAIVLGFSTDGVTWNVDDVANGIDTNNGNARPKYTFMELPYLIGVANGINGQPMPYFLDNGNLYMLDFYKETAVRIAEVADKARIVAAAVFEGFIWCSDGWNVWVYDPGAAATVRRVGLFDRYGAPPSLRNMTLATFIGGTSTLYALLIDDKTVPTHPTYQLAAFTGQGWAPIGPVYSDRAPISGLINRFPTGLALSVPQRFIDVLATTVQAGTTIRLDSFAIPNAGDIPVSGTTTFDAGPDQIITGWYDGGFIDLFGALHRMYIHGFNISATETVKVEYQLDQNESGAWTTLGTFTANTGTIWFDATNHRGIKFRTARFRITMVRGGTTTATPELIAIVLVYDKKPEFRSLWTFRVDANLMIEEHIPVTNNILSLTEAGTTVTVVTQYPHNYQGIPGESVTIAGAADAKYNGIFTLSLVVSRTSFQYVAAAGAVSPDVSTTATWTADATLGRVWSFLKASFDVKTLIPLTIPNVEDAWSPGLNVRIVDVPVSFDDFRTAVMGKGYIEVQVLQPVGINQ
jgi:hypothetical protein